ncbi:anti-sigma factor family protein [Paludifilum halophilum]|uniref:Anti-sigma-W factor RsiW n=1 Tax=Paludifilum halophilum TaxID=1642702 RepID=A0A235B5F8_9BACL|nr:zf-HC2 domain-containing protein [Paludifilum halophilum]OYD07524.1 hypothetical protein CHM34_11560 [Paludifilum halophilum]
MPCPVKTEEIIAFSLNELSRKESERVESHLSSCADCRQIRRELTAFQQAWEKPEGSPSLGFVEEVMDSLPESTKRPVRFPQRVRSIWKAYRMTGVHLLVASAATVVLSHLGWFRLFPDAMLHISAGMELLSNEPIDTLLQYKLNQYLS